MLDQLPAWKTLVALAALALTVSGFQQLLVVPSGYAAPQVAAVA